ncbi:MAG: amino acid ABC transporter permease [Alicyclobacillus herbarius]|uniref:amino acid ABC transporter permease n=1 Tax=Alicyclobacillus herbarius TaxID=122960 RepID=UPI002352055A|nr:amino acid ABC transporter permease [Alicyclobacillus herbarius]MCL6633332.1 amino acid ABC transporter permease [Alicyclobacillus herbarius]
MGTMVQLWQTYGGQFLHGALVTLEMTVLSLAAAVVFGVALALTRMSKLRPLRAAASVYVELVRSTPVIVELFFVYYSLAEFGLVIPGFAAAVIVLGGFYGALYSEIFRSGLLSIDKGQTEAAAALGLRRKTTFFRVLVPQSLLAVLPPGTSAAVDLIKDTALVVTIGVAELMYQAYQAGSDTFLYMDVFLIAGVIYFIACYGLSYLARRWENRVKAIGA